MINPRISSPNPTDEQGFILVAALMILLVLSLIGIAINRNTTTELKIAANDKVHKQTFYHADGGTEFAAEIIEQNIACIDFAAGGDGVLDSDLDGDGNNELTIDGNIVVDDGSFQLWQNAMGTYSGGGAPYPSDTVRDMWLPPNYATGQPHTNITVEGISNLATGASIIMAAGYLGLGRSMAAGGVTLDYEIDSYRIGVDNSETLIRVEYRHIVGKEDNFCRYN